jgi:hypothetical protein
VIEEVLCCVADCQEKGGFSPIVQMADEVHSVMVIPVIALVNGNAKSGNALASQFGSKNCITRVPGFVAMDCFKLIIQCTNANVFEC